MSDRLKVLTEAVTTRRPELELRKGLVKSRLESIVPAREGDLLSKMFGMLCDADLNSVGLESAFSGISFGFAQHDSRYLRSLRDQVLGNGVEAKPLTKAQLASVRTILQREAYLTQVALLLDVPQG
jgi:hypothetical protein